jgi:hypothetical protein
MSAKRSRIGVLGSLGLLVPLLGCGGSEGSQMARPAYAGPAVTSACDVAEQCPTMIPGVEASTAETSNGIAITLSAPPAEVERIRRMIGHMAEVQNRREAMAQGQEAAPMHPGLLTIPAWAATENTERGARLILTANDPSQVEELRRQIRAHVELWSSGNCAPATQPQP